MSLFVDDLILKENPQSLLLELIKDFSKVAGYRANIQKSTTFLYTNNETSEKEIKKTILFIIASKSIKSLEINLIKAAKDLYNKKHKTLP